MTVRPISQNDRSSSLNTVIRSTAVGTAIGYGLKYAWPVTKQEDTFSRRDILKVNRKSANNDKVAEIKAQGEKTKAQVAFVRMVESEDDAFSSECLERKIKALGGENSADGKEFKRLIRSVNETASKNAKLDIIGRKIAIKWTRPAIPFLVAGAGVGFLAGFAHNVMKTDYYA